MWPIDEAMFFLKSDTELGVRLIERNAAQDIVEYFVVCLHVHITVLCSRRCIHRMAIKL